MVRLLYHLFMIYLLFVGSFTIGWYARGKALTPEKPEEGDKEEGGAS